MLIEAKENKIQSQLAANRYVGVGIALSMDKEEKRASIMTVIRNGPAWHGGMKAKDIILTIDGESTESKDLVQVVEELRGEAGSEVTIVVRQPQAEESRELKLTRGRVFIPTIAGIGKTADDEPVFVIESAKEFALVQINQFGPSTLHELKQVEAKLRGENIRGIILDLRSEGGGGLLHDCVLVADALLKAGVIGHVRDADKTQTFKAKSGTLFQDLPIVVWVSRHSETTAVFLTAALQDQGRAVIVGEPTVGKRFVRSNVKLPGREEQIQIATAVLQRGDGTPLLGREENQYPMPLVLEGQTVSPKGRPGFIIPDHVVLMTNRDRKEVESSLLNKSLEVLRKVTGQESTPPKPKPVSG